MDDLKKTNRMNKTTSSPGTLAVPAICITAARNNLAGSEPIPLGDISEIVHILNPENLKMVAKMEFEIPCAFGDLDQIHTVDQISELCDFIETEYSKINYSLLSILD